MRFVPIAPETEPHREGDGVVSPALAWAGIAGPALFAVLFLAQDAARYEGFSPLRDPVSAFAAGPHGWVQQLGFAALGLLTTAHAVGLHLALRPTPGGVLGPAALFVTGVGNLLAIPLPLRAAADGTFYDPGGHVVAGVLFFLGSPVALILLSLRMRHDPRWRGLAVGTLVCGLLLVLSAVLMTWLVLPAEAPLHHLAGLFQRLIVLLVLFPARIAIGLRMLAVVRDG